MRASTLCVPWLVLLLPLLVLIGSCTSASSAAAVSTVVPFPSNNRSVLSKKITSAATTTTTTKSIYRTNLRIIRGGTTSTADGATSPLLEGLKNSLASALAAGCSKTLLAPFDTLKTVQQQYGGGLGLLEAASMIMERPNGFWELYAGLGVSVLGSMPSVGLYFGVYSYSKRTLAPMLREMNSNENNSMMHLSDGVIRSLTIAASAAIGNTIASFSRVPYEVVKQKLQTGQYSSTYGAIRAMATQQGWRAFFPMGGVSIQMLRDIPYAMVTLLSYEFLRDIYVTPWQQDHPNENPLFLDMLVGATAGGIGSFVTNPLDVIKTRLQTNPEFYNGRIAKCFAATYAEGGAGAFLRGSVPRLLHKIPANGFFFLFYEFFKRILDIDAKT